jgi:glycerol-3-phosphate acyltransferase PlsY
MPAWLVILTGYLIGAIPTAFIAGRLSGGRDIRRMGDANSGAANAFRELGHRTGVLVGVIDAAKGALVILVARAFEVPFAIVMLAGLAAVIGHNWPVYLGFRGGRGVSTTIGILAVLVTVPMLILAAPAVLVLLWRKNVAPAMAVLFVLLPAVDLLLGVDGALILYGLGLAVLVGFTHFLRTRERALRQA